MTQDKRCLMAIFAHPDDEAFGNGGSLARYVSEGCEVVLVTATRGEAGQISSPELATEATLPEVREQELRNACAAYGIAPPILLGYLDGQLPMVVPGQGVARLVRLIRQYRPQVVLSFGPDGGYGHYDHLVIHRWATIAVELASEADWFPGGPENAREPHQVAKFYHTAMRRSEAEGMRQRMGRRGVMMGGVPFAFSGVPDDQITTIIDISAYAEKKYEGILCHRTQVGPRSPFAGDRAEILAQPRFREETFVLAQSTLPWPTETETDLFAGLD